MLFCVVFGVHIPVGYNTFTPWHTQNILKLFMDTCFPLTDWSMIKLPFDLLPQIGPYTVTFRPLGLSHT